MKNILFVINTLGGITTLVGFVWWAYTFYIAQKYFFIEKEEAGHSREEYRDYSIYSLMSIVFALLFMKWINSNASEVHGVLKIIGSIAILSLMGLYSLKKQNLISPGMIIATTLLLYITIGMIRLLYV